MNRQIEFRPTCNLRVYMPYRVCSSKSLQGEGLCDIGVKRQSPNVTYSIILLQDSNGGSPVSRVFAVNALTVTVAVVAAAVVVATVACCRPGLPQ